MARILLILALAAVLAGCCVREVRFEFNDNRSYTTSQPEKP
jgi:PBP1b-binding outer membrane lipoprotein LpoB